MCYMYRFNKYWCWKCLLKVKVNATFYILPFIVSYQRIDFFELWVPWTARRSNQSILKEISPEYSLEELMLKLKLQNFGHLKQRTDSFEKTLMLERLKAGGEGDDRGWGDWMASLTQWTWVWVNSGIWWWTERPGVLQFMGSQRIGHDWDWTDDNLSLCTFSHYHKVKMEVFQKKEHHFKLLWRDSHNTSN